MILDPASWTLIAITVAALILFISDRFPIDSIAFMVLLALMLTNLVPAEYILDGFSNPATMTVAALFVVSAGLERTGVVRFIAQRLGKLVKEGQTLLAFVLSLTTGAFSAFINSTATVAIMLPVALKLSRKTKVSPTQLLMTLSFAAQFGGVCTLIGSSINLLVNGYATSAGLAGFSLFEFSKLGIICFVVGTAYMLIASRFLLKPRVSPEDIESSYKLSDYLLEMAVLESSPLIGESAPEGHIEALGKNITVLEIIRHGQFIWAGNAGLIREGDKLLLRGEANAILDQAERLKLQDWGAGKLPQLKADKIQLVEVQIPRTSSLIGKSLRQVDFFWRYHAAVLGLKRHGEVLEERISELTFHSGDQLLLQGHHADLEQLADTHDFQLLQNLSSLKLNTKRAFIALLVMAGFVLAAASPHIPVLAAAFGAAAAMVFFRCINLHQAYQSVDIKVIMLLACLIPLGIAMQKTGLAAQFVQLGLDQPWINSPQAALVVIYAVTMLLTAVMSNAATAALMAPLALVLAGQMNVAAEPFLVAVTFAASTCFTTPVGYQTNTMVYGPGGYKYTDFLRVGLPLNLIFLAMTTILIPKFWPF